MYRSAPPSIPSRSPYVPVVHATARSSCFSRFCPSQLRSPLLSLQFFTQRHEGFDDAFDAMAKLLTGKVLVEHFHFVMAPIERAFRRAHVEHAGTQRVGETDGIPKGTPSLQRLTPAKECQRVAQLGS